MGKTWKMFAMLAHHPETPDLVYDLVGAITKINTCTHFNFRLTQRSPAVNTTIPMLYTSPTLLKYCKPSVSSTECTTFQHRGNIIISFSPSASPTQTLLGNSCVEPLALFLSISDCEPEVQISTSDELQPI